LAERSVIIKKLAVQTLSFYILNTLWF